MLDYLRSKIPGKRLIRAALAPMKRAYDEYQLGSCIESLRDGSRIDAALLRRARRAWGNEGFSADLVYLEEVLVRVERSTGPVLECGTGLTTLLAGAIAERRGFGLFSLEQDRQWADVIANAMARFRVRATVYYAPLRQYGDFVWYDLAGIELPRSFDLVLCDGPAVLDTWSADIRAQWRVGLLPVLATVGATVREVLLDDVDEPRAPQLLQRWRRDFGADESIISTPVGNYAVIRPEAPFSPPA